MELKKILVGIEGIKAIELTVWLISQIPGGKQ